ncbi:MAG: lysostaphin resistance A-like protein [Pseudanabaenaceae cyanobacterium]
MADDQLAAPRPWQRWLVVALAFCCALFVAQALIESARSPQAQTQLDAIETDLRLLARYGEEGDLLPQALQQYRRVRASSQRVAVPTGLDVRIGLLEAAGGKPSAALATWQGAIAAAPSPTIDAYAARVLQGLWSTPPVILPEAEAVLQEQLAGWFQGVALNRLYELQQRDRDRERLQEKLLVARNKTRQRLIWVNGVPVAVGGLGAVLGLGLLVQLWLWPERSPLVGTLSWEPVPWPWERAWTVMVFWLAGFIALSQVLPGLLTVLGALLKQGIGGSPFRYQAATVLLSYGLTVSPMVPLVNGCVREAGWQDRWWDLWVWDRHVWLWGIGGYGVAMPLVLAASWVSERLWQGLGGGNPLLPILVESQDNVAKFLLWLTVAVAAPVAEEFLFRGFWLRSLLKTLPTWGAVALSAVGFAVVHLNVVDLLPLTVLGVVLGFVFVRSQRLPAVILLHALWNTGSFVALLALGQVDV